jgi:hypothetical protein
MAPEHGGIAQLFQSEFLLKHNLGPDICPDMWSSFTLDLLYLST